MRWRLIHILVGCVGLWCDMRIPLSTPDFSDRSELVAQKYPDGVRDAIEVVVTFDK